MNNPICINTHSLYTPSEHISPARILIDNGTIAAAGRPDDVKVPPHATAMDLSDLTAVPGFIEPHVHGSAGADVMDGSFEALNTISCTLARHGTTAFLATTVSARADVLSAAIRNLSVLSKRSYDGAHLLGIHLEGPFINSLQRGTHRNENISPPDLALFTTWLEAAGSSIRLITLAPECHGARKILEEARRHGVSVAMGHSNATLEEAESAVNNGVSYAVHTFNAMRAFTHRDPGIVGAVLSDDRVFAEIIADGIHVHPQVVKFFARSKKADRIVLVTDAVSATDMPDGTYALGTDTVVLRDGVCRNSEGRLAGSTLTQEKALKNFMEWTGFGFAEALQGLTLNPATVLNLPRKGRIEPGADADITLLDAGCRVMKTFAGGKLVFDRSVWTN